MPVILDPADYAPWLGEEPESGLGVGFLPRLFPAEAMVAYPAGKRVSSPANDDPECIAAVTAADAGDPTARPNCLWVETPASDRGTARESGP